MGVTEMVDVVVEMELRVVVLITVEGAGETVEIEENVVVLKTVDGEAVTVDITVETVQVASTQLGEKLEMMVTFAQVGDAVVFENIGPVVQLGVTVTVDVRR